jgi:hypothetical protein
MEGEAEGEWVVTARKKSKKQKSNALPPPVVNDDQRGEFCALTASPGWPLSSRGEVFPVKKDSCPNPLNFRKAPTSTYGALLRSLPRGLENQKSFLLRFQEFFSIFFLFCRHFPANLNVSKWMKPRGRGWCGARGIVPFFLSDAPLGHRWDATGGMAITTAEKNLSLSVMTIFSSN